MEEFLNIYSTLPKDFFIIAKETYDENEIVINFDIVSEWLNIRKDHFK
jgi:hypothetical protein